MIWQYCSWKKDKNLEVSGEQTTPQSFKPPSDTLCSIDYVSMWLSIFLLRCPWNRGPRMAFSLIWWRKQLKAINAEGLMTQKRVEEKIIWQSKYTTGKDCADWLYESIWIYCEQFTFLTHENWTTKADQNACPINISGVWLPQGQSQRTPMWMCRSSPENACNPSQARGFTHRSNEEDFAFIGFNSSLYLNTTAEYVAQKYWNCVILVTYNHHNDTGAHWISLE